MGREFELKYRATLHQQQAIRAAFDGPWKEISMATAYYDTPTGELSRRKWTLRRRLEEVNPGCYLQVDGGVDANTQAICKESGADVLVSGSAYFKNSDKPGFIALIQNESMQ